MKHVALSMITLLAVASLGLLGAYAGFVDTEVSRENTVEAGTLDLVLSDGDPSGFGHGVQNTWSIYLAFPHDSVSRSVQLINFGTLGDYLDVQSQSTNDWRVVPPPPQPPLLPKDEVLIITDITYASGTPFEETIVWVDDMNWPDVGGYNFNAARITDFNLDGFISLDDLEKQTIEFTPAPDSGPTSFRMAVQFEPQFGPYPDNEYQDIETDTTVIFTLR
jgi:hypothetical protein